jgi:hypothetical protein
MKSYDKWVDAYPIDPPIDGTFSWAAKAKVKESGTGAIDNIVVLSEHLGQSKEEVSSKARAEAQSWIDRKLNNAG